MSNCYTCDKVFSIMIIIIIIGSFIVKYFDLCEYFAIFGYFQALVK